MTIFHKTVLIKETIEYLNPQPNKLYLDLTFGGGGHTKAILEKEKKCKVIALDWNKETIDKNAPNLKDIYQDRLTVLWGNFANLDKILKKENITSVDGILADFGTSQFQIQNIPGLSFMSDTQLDMRLNPSAQYTKASDILNRFTEKELADIFFNYGEEWHARKIAKKIVEYRKIEKFRTSGQLAKFIETILPVHKKQYKKHKIHPATKVFQALRIVVNNELENINLFLKLSLSFLNINGRIVCISFHSLEDRIVKNFFRQNSENLKILTKKPVTASEEELKENPSCRSAKLRAAEKIY